MKLQRYFSVVALFIASFALQAQENSQKAVPFFINGEAQKVEAFSNEADWIRHDLFVETDFDTDGDGKKDRMHVSVTRPKQTETEGLKLPVIYASSPYYSGTAGNADIFWDVKHELGETPPARKHAEVVRRSQRPVISNSEIKKWVPYGYIVVHSSSPGTGLSQGSPTVGGDNESFAPAAVIDWLCGRRPGYTELDSNEEVTAFWSTGKVGMTGTSYNGTIPLAAATTGVEGLEAIIPIAPNTSYYHYYRSHGLVRSPGGYLGEDIDVLYDFIHSGEESRRAYNNKTTRDTEMAQGMDRITGDYNEFWAGRDYLNDMAPMKAALLMSHGFNDWNVMPEHSYRIYAKAREMGLPAQIYYHQKGHGGPPPFTQMNRWFTRYLHGVENGVENDQKAWIVREGQPINQPTPYADYPNPEASDVTFYFSKGGNTAGALSLEKTQNQGKENLIDDVSISGSQLAADGESSNRLLYVTPQLKQPLHLSGTSTIKIRLASSKSAANLSVWMVSLPWDNEATLITDNIITRGWADPQNYKSLSESEPLIPGIFYELEFELQPDDQVIRAGQQIGIMIFSSDKEFTLWPEAGTALIVDLEGTEISIPVVGGKEAYRKATE